MNFGDSAVPRPLDARRRKRPPCPSATLFPAVLRTTCFFLQTLLIRCRGVRRRRTLEEMRYILVAYTIVCSLSLQGERQWGSGRNAVWLRPNICTKTGPGHGKQSRVHRTPAILQRRGVYFLWDAVGGERVGHAVAYEQSVCAERGTRLWRSANAHTALIVSAGGVPGPRRGRWRRAWPAAAPRRAAAAPRRPRARRCRC